MARRQFKWRDPPYEYEHDKMPIDILAGSPAARADRAAAAACRHCRELAPGEAEFAELRREYLLY
jgi:hypothetical protein